MKGDFNEILVEIWMTLPIMLMNTISTLAKMLLTKGNFVVLNLGLTFAFALKIKPYRTQQM